MIGQSPGTLAASYAEQFLRHLPAVRDGDAGGVHQARVATRRFREVAPLLVPSWGREAEAWTSLARRAGRHLGRVRELDVMHEMLAARDASGPALALVAAVARSALGARRQLARRRLIKALERLEVARLSDVVPRLTHRWSVLRERHSDGRWTDLVRERLATRGDKLREAVAHATGVYFPNRSHRARVAVKKLRYTVEIAGATGLWQPPHLLQDLRRIQTALGRAHDLQVLSDRLEELIEDPNVRAQAAVLSSALRIEAATEFASYVARRDRLMMMCDASARFASRGRGPTRRRVMALSKIVVPAGVLLLGAQQRRRTS